LRECCPEAFRVPRPPLAIGIHRQIFEVMGDDLDRRALPHFLRVWVRRFDYLDAIAHGEMRLNLDGSPAGLPTEDEQLHAARRVLGPRAEKLMAKIASRVAKHT
jgi:sRNA-binding protein